MNTARKQAAAKYIESGCSKQDNAVPVANVPDDFDAICSDLNTGLEAEIEVRRKQYAYYRDLLLAFAESGSTGLTAMA